MGMAKRILAGMVVLVLVLCFLFLFVGCSDGSSYSSYNTDSGRLSPDEQEKARQYEDTYNYLKDRFEKYEKYKDSQ